METINEIFTTKQYKNKQLQLQLGNFPKCDLKTDGNLFYTSSAGPSHAGGSQMYENEAVDLTLLDSQHGGFLRKRMYFTGSQNRIGLDKDLMEQKNSRQYISPPRKKRRRRNQFNDFVVDYSEVQNIQNATKTIEIPLEVLGEIYDKASSPEALQNNADARVDEVMKAAKSLFSKRTRTLYHWMHPNAPKPQIKAAVSASWDSLGTQEKQFYISQVLGRFGFPQCNLMINPQLGGIKELPPVPDIPEFTDVSTNELQNAISSISSDGSSIFLPEQSFRSNFRPISRKKRLGRPPGSKNKKNASGEILRGPIHQDFQDDPELNEELQQFTLNLNIP